MKKIFVLELNEKDKKLKDVKLVKKLDEIINSFGKEINGESEIFIKFKRIGNTWDNIVNDAINEENNNSRIKYLDSKDHLKIIK